MLDYKSPALKFCFGVTFSPNDPVVLRVPPLIILNTLVWSVSILFYVILCPRSILDISRWALYVDCFLLKNSISDSPNGFVDSSLT
jgi:hypothetical protein